MTKNNCKKGANEKFRINITKNEKSVGYYPICDTRQI